MRYSNSHFSVFKLFTLAFVLLSQVSCSSQSVTTSKSDVVEPSKVEIEFVAEIEGIREYRLSNGMKVLLNQDAANTQALLNIVYRVGSVHEKYGETGMAHLLEHMLFKGSVNFPDITGDMNRRGIKANATTYLDRTNYYEMFDGSDDNLTWALGMEADRMVNATFSEEELKSEMKVVKNELARGENNVGRILHQRILSSAFLWHNYGNSTIGAPSDIENVPFTKLRQFYKTHYRPDNAVLTLSGRFNEAYALNAIKQTFGRIAKPVEPIEPLYTEEPTQDGERTVNLRRTGERPTISLSYHTVGAQHSDSAALAVLAKIINDQHRGRLQKSLVETELASGAYAWLSSFNQRGTFFFTVAGFSDKPTEQLEVKLIKAAEDIKNNKITAEEVNLAKTTLLTDHEKMTNNVISLAQNLTTYISQGDYKLVFLYRDLLKEVTQADVQRVAETYLKRSNRTLGRFIPTAEPDRVEIPAKSDLTERLNTYKGQQTIVKGEVYDNSIANINARLKEFNWPMGTSVSVYPKKLRAEDIFITMRLNAGNVEYFNGKEHAKGLLGSMMLKGNEGYSKEQIAIKLDQLKAVLSIRSGKLGTIIVSIKTSKPKLDETLAFAAEILTAPTFDESELELSKSAWISSLESDRNEPGTLASRKFDEIFNPYPAGHPQAYQAFEQEIDNIKAISRQQLIDLHKDLIVLNNGQISVTGDVDPEMISNQLHAEFGHLSGDVEYQRILKKYAAPSGENTWIETPDKANATLYVAHIIEMNSRHQDYPALVIANEIWGGGGVLSSRLMRRIRKKEGYSYSVRSALSSHYLEPQTMYYMSAIAAPENVEGVLAAYREELDRAMKEGFTQQEVSGAIQSKLTDIKRNLTTDRTLNRILAVSKALDRPINWYDDYRTRIAAVTVQDVNKVFNKYIATSASNVITAGDFKAMKGI